MFGEAVSNRLLLCMQYAYTSLSSHDRLVLRVPCVFMPLNVCAEISCDSLHFPSLRTLYFCHHFPVGCLGSRYYFVIGPRMRREAEDLRV